MNRALYPLLLAVPGAAILWALNQNGDGQYNLWVFILTLAGLVPLASIIGSVTDRLSDYVGPRISGFISASFSNVPELAIGGFFLWHAGQVASPENDFTIVRGLLIGSIINNILLVLGVSVFFGGLRHGKLKFDKDQAAGFASMLALAVVGLALPTLAVSFAEKSADAEENLLKLNTTSLVVSALLIVIYVVYVGAEVFGLGERPSKAALRAAASEHEHEGHEGHEGHEHHHEHISAEEKEAEREQEERAKVAQAAHEARVKRRRERPWMVWVLLGALTVATLITVMLAFFLVDVSEHVITGTFLTPLSVGFIIFPIVCNFGELVAAFGSAWRGRIEEGMEVASGSSVQVPLFVTPALVFISFILAAGNPELVLPLEFKSLELIVVGLAVFVYALVNLDGETSWLEGLQLLAFFTMIAVTAFVLPGA